MLLLCCLRGSIILYQGEELGLPQVDVPFEQLQDPEAIANWPQTLSRDGARTPMPWISAAESLGFSTGTPWLPAGESHRPLAVDRQEQDPRSLLAFTRKCLDLRRSNRAIRHGSMEIVETSDRVLVFERLSGAERVRCTFNLSNLPIKFSASGRTLILAGELDRTNLGPYSSIVEDIA
jgi:alpha-glucosidase